MLGCTPQAYNTCVCLYLRWRKEPGGSNRDIKGLRDGGAYTSEARSYSVYIGKPTGPGSSLYSLREEDATSFRGN